jgi:starch synthase
MAPFAKAGQLADEVADLAEAVRALGHDVSVVIPFYRSTREGMAKKPKRTGVKFNVSVGPGRYPCEVYEARAGSGVQVFLIGRDEFFDRSGLYGVDGRDYQDNAARFIFLTKCALELARRMEPAPDVIHAHGWQTALAPVFLREQQLPFRSVLTPHTLMYQGNFWSYDFALTNLPGEYFSARGVEYYGSMNCLKGGILFADAVVLPGERAVAACQAGRFGSGLESVLREHQHKLWGIPDGREAFGWEAAGPRVADRDALLARLGLDAAPTGGVFVAFSDASDGVGCLLDALDLLVVDDVRVVVIGAVDVAMTGRLEVARRRHRGRFAQVALDDSLARLALAGADFQIFPGELDAGAAWMLRGLRCGAVPVAAHCGGLFQFVRAGRNGIVFFAPTADGLREACRRGSASVRDGSVGALREACVGMDFSTSASALRHEGLYDRLVSGRRLAA